MSLCACVCSILFDNIVLLQPHFNFIWHCLMPKQILPALRNCFQILVQTNVFCFVSKDIFQYFFSLVSLFLSFIHLHFFTPHVLYQIDIEYHESLKFVSLFLFISLDIYFSTFFFSNLQLKTTFNASIPHWFERPQLHLSVQNNFNTM